MVSVAFIYLGIMLYQICQGDFSDGSLQNDDNFYSYGTEEYGSSCDDFTNSQYLRSSLHNITVIEKKKKAVLIWFNGNSQLYKHYCCWIKRRSMAVFALSQINSNQVTEIYSSLLSAKKETMS